MTNRDNMKSDSNNPDNQNQNVCALEVCRYLGVQDDVRYLHTTDDIRRAIDKRYCPLLVNKLITGKTVGSIRKEVKRIGANFYLLWLPGHVILLDAMGKTVADSDPGSLTAEKCGECGAYTQDLYNQLNRSVNMKDERRTDSTIPIRELHRKVQGMLMDRHITKGQAKRLQSWYTAIHYEQVQLEATESIRVGGTA